MQAGDLDGAEKLLQAVSPLAPDYKRIAQSLALVQSLKGAQPSNLGCRYATARAICRTQRRTRTAFHPRCRYDPSIRCGGAGHSFGHEQAPYHDFDVRHGASAPPSQAAEPMQPPSRGQNLRTEKDRPSKLDALRADRVWSCRQFRKTIWQPAQPQTLVNDREGIAAPQKQIEAPAARQTSSDAKQLSQKAVYVQAGSYLSEDRATKASSGLESLGVRVMSGFVNGRTVYRVRIGPFLTLGQAKEAFALAQAHGRSDLMIVRE